MRASRTATAQWRHTRATQRAATVRSLVTPVVPPTCGDPLRGSASAVPDLTLTPRDPEGEVGNGSGKWWCRPARGGNHRGTCPYPGSPRFPPAPLFLQPLRPTRWARFAGKSAAVQASKQQVWKHGGTDRNLGAVAWPPGKVEARRRAGKT
jgi:hypothetical protein